MSEIGVLPAVSLAEKMRQKEISPVEVVEAHLSRIERLRDEWPAHLPLLDTLQAQYAHRASHLGNSHNGVNGDSLAGEEFTEAENEDQQQELLEHHLIRRAVLDTERTAVLDLRERGEIDDNIWRQIERDLDLEELRADA